MRIPYGRQSISNSDIESVVNVLKSDFLTQGPKVPEFENKVSTAVGAKYAVAANSATSALHLACLSLELNAGDIVWTSPISFVHPLIAHYIAARQLILLIFTPSHLISLLLHLSKLKIAKIKVIFLRS